MEITIFKNVDQYAVVGLPFGLVQLMFLSSKLSLVMCLVSLKSLFSPIFDLKPSF